MLAFCQELVIFVYSDCNVDLLVLYAVCVYYADL